MSKKDNGVAPSRNSDANVDHEGKDYYYSNNNNSRLACFDREEIKGRNNFFLLGRGF